MPHPTSLTALCDATIFTGDAFVENHALLIAEGRIVDIVGPARIPQTGQRLSCGGLTLAPGFVDAQVNGGGNIFFNNSPTAEGGAAIADAHLQFGTTRLLLTCITDAPDVTRGALQAARKARRNHQSVLGIHIEGPHLDVAGRGVHKEEHVRAMSAEDLALYTCEDQETMVITVAPEGVTEDQIATLRSQGVIISLGHTNATPEQIREALRAGATGFTHLFNGMGHLAARAPGPAGVALDDRDSWCSLIADGYHVSPEMIRLALRAKPKGKIFLISDAMPPAATDRPQPFQLYGDTIRVENGYCVNDEGRLAGAAITLLEAVRHCVFQVGVELGEALRMASTVPATFLGLGSVYGKLSPGYVADIVALNARIELKGVWRSGVPVKRV
ncbi:MAG: N-acetylglucosamine-6-phosphate deacetylase [Pseudomonadota bacterium]|nr:N-acetylglucosamine-6-phosphate deacetylase [Pseudomonadota bacterium]